MSIPTGDPVVSRGDRLLYLGAFPVGHGAVDWGSGAMWLLAPAIALALDLSPTQVGLLFTLKMLGAGLMYVPAGILGDSMRGRGLLLLSTFWLVAVAYIVASLMSSFWVLVLFMTIAAAGAGAWHPVAMGTMVQRMPRRRGFALAVHGLGGTVSEVAAPLSVGFLLIYLDWRETLQLTTFPAIIMGFIFLRLATKVAPPEQRRPSRGEFIEVLRLWSRRAGVTVLLVFALYNMSVMALMSMIALYLEDARGLSSGVARGNLRRHDPCQHGSGPVVWSNLRRSGTEARYSGGTGAGQRLSTSLGDFNGYCGSIRVSHGGRSVLAWHSSGSHRDGA